MLERDLILFASVLLGFILGSIAGYYGQRKKEKSK